MPLDIINYLINFANAYGDLKDKSMPMQEAFPTGSIQEKFLLSLVLGFHEKLPQLRLVKTVATAPLHLQSKSV